jgi:two-component system chemotaxis response regulator CheY
MARTVLFVDDSSTIITTVKIALEGVPFHVVTAHDGVEAMRRIRMGLRPDVIVTDLNMPAMGGLELIAQVKGLLPSTPIVVMSVETLQLPRDEARRLGAAGWIVKPIGREALIDTLNQLLPVR